jgi:hypothetical protein
MAEEHHHFIRKPPLTPEQVLVRNRWARLTEWHTLESDLTLDDFDFVKVMFQRMEAHFARPLIDPAE